MKKFIKPLLMLLLITSLAIKGFCVPKLNSLPSAPATIFLDFDGHCVINSMWNNGDPLFCAAAPMTDVQITEVFNRVAEDFRPFNLNVTTDSVKYLAAPLVQRIRIIITPTSGWYPGVGGVSFVGSFTWGNETPGFVFTDRLPVGGPVIPKMIAECCSHESGHTLSLSHQSKYDGTCGQVEIYNTGSGTGEVAWSPVMGNSYYRNMTGWNDGPTQYGCTLTQDNLSIITTQNGFTYRTDDYAEILNTSAYNLGISSYNTSGIITTSTDKDAFRFALSQNSNFHLSAVPFNVGANGEGANLDIKIVLYNSAGSLIRTYDPMATLSVTIDTFLNAGSYYLRIDGTGNANVSEYGSLGSYTITGFASGTLPIKSVQLNGKVNKTNHDLSWQIVSDEPIKTTAVEVSGDGFIFHELALFTPAGNTYSYNPFADKILYYRLRVVSVRNQEMYSNVIALRATEKGEKSFVVTTFVQNDISVNASEAYFYRLLDMNGRQLLTGKGNKGVNKIELKSALPGVYLLELNRLATGVSRQVERIVKQ